MTFVSLVCPNCRHRDVYEERNLEASSEISCPACGFSGLPTSYELAESQNKTTWDPGKLVIIVLAGIAFVFAWLWVITLAAFYAPIILVVAVVILLYRRRMGKKGERAGTPSPSSDSPVNSL